MVVSLKYTSLICKHSAVTLYLWIQFPLKSAELKQKYPTALDKFSITVIKRHDQKQLGGGGYFILEFLVHYPGNPG